MIREEDARDAEVADNEGNQRLADVLRGRRLSGDVREDSLSHRAAKTSHLYLRAILSLDTSIEDVARRDVEGVLSDRRNVRLSSKMPGNFDEGAELAAVDVLYDVLIHSSPIVSSLDRVSCLLDAEVPVAVVVCIANAAPKPRWSDHDAVRHSRNPAEEDTVTQEEER